MKASPELAYKKRPDYCKLCGVLFEDVHASGNVRSSHNPLVCVPCWNAQDFQKWAELAVATGAIELSRMELGRKIVADRRAKRLRMSHNGQECTC